MKKLSALFLVLFSVNSFAKSWDLNDVTYIMPLPHDINTNNLISISDKGLGGEFITTDMMNTIPSLSMRHEDEDIVRLLRVMAVRIDPCFPLPTPTSCQRQIRFVWQPLELGPQKQVQTIDAALHSFYVLTDEEFTKLTADLQAWKKKFATTESTSSQALDIHPYWRKDKDQSKALLAFNDIIKKYAGKQNISRVTAMVLRRMNDVWGFLAFDADAEKKLSIISIPRLAVGENQNQVFTTNINKEDQFVNAQMSPRPETKEANLDVFVNNPGVLTEKELLENLSMSLKIENPKIFNPENMDCVNCHIAQPARQWITEQKKWETLEVEYKNTNYDLSNKSTKLLSTKQMRGVGYFADRLVIAQRTINESAEVADWLNNQNSERRKK